MITIKYDNVLLNTMTHKWFEDYMENLSKQDPYTYLENFEDIHVYWHMENPFLGFLSFHRTVIDTLRTSLRGAGADLPSAWTTAEPAYLNWIDDIKDAEEFSEAIQFWHNGVHNNPNYSEIMNPRTNIYTVRFWGLHVFIDEKFTDWLKRNNTTFDQIDHDRV